MEAFTEAEGFFLVNLVPWLQYLPSWFPGAGFMNLAKEGYRKGMDMYIKPHEMSKKLIVSIVSLDSELPMNGFFFRRAEMLFRPYLVNFLTLIGMKMGR